MQEEGLGLIGWWTHDDDDEEDDEPDQLNLKTKLCYSHSTQTHTQCPKGASFYPFFSCRNI